jgi:ATP-dependent protease ClpP protease subunit
MALIGATTILLAEGGMAATITVHAPDREGRVFVDVVGTINDGDFKTFTEKTDQINPIGTGHPNKQVIVTLMSYGGSISSGLQIGDYIRKRVYPPSSLAIARARALAHSSGLPEGPERSVTLHR